LAGHGHRWDASDSADGNGGLGGDSGGSSEVDSSGRRADYIYGRGDGSLLHPKFTGLAVYARDSLVACGRVKILQVASCATAVLTSKGGAACCLALDGQSVAFVSCHLEVCGWQGHARVHARAGLASASALLSRLLLLRTHSSDAPHAHLLLPLTPVLLQLCRSRVVRRARGRGCRRPTSSRSGARSTGS
jgi:hypothetical protein